MIWWLAYRLDDEHGYDGGLKEWVEYAQQFYKRGIEKSPGVQSEREAGAERTMTTDDHHGRDA